ncbi:MAG TPA: cytidine deaminase [Candidatus Tripitaka californicus]|uniref:cytidine deaminase n=1 Tax=Candidatus Tripitaka californicus TaxID=3367616 RepID=UPI0040282C19|nr:cytidine deaminase [Planctomycetota bacterium]
MEELIKKAIEARDESYSPYSHFKVGAALKTRSGKVYAGTNVENASYGLTVCAERVAVYKAVSAGEREFEALAVFTEADELTPPCGACRQVLWEFSKDMLIILANTKGEKRLRLSELLPMPFERKEF